MKDKTKKHLLFAGFIVIFILLVLLPSYASSYRVIFVTNILMYVILTLSWVIFRDRPATFLLRLQHFLASVFIRLQY